MCVEEFTVKDPVVMTSTRWIVAACVVPLLGACSGLTIHDASRAQLAAQGKQAYADAKISEVADTEKKNLDFLLAEEIKVARESSNLEADFAALSMAANTGPMARVIDDANRHFQAIGFADAAAVRAAIEADLHIAGERNKQRSMAKVLRSYKLDPPDCAGLPPNTPTLPDANAAVAYKSYVNSCQAIAKLAPNPRGGRIGHAFRDWQSAMDKQAELESLKNLALKESLRAANEYRQAVAENAAPKAAAVAANAELKSKEEALAKALAALGKLHLPGTFDDSINALALVLSAAAGGDADGAHPDLVLAVAVIKQLPALNQAAAAFQASRTAIPVSGLLLELKRQTLLADTATQRQQLQEARVDILHAKYAGYKTEAQRWLALSDAMCSYTLLSAGKPHPGAGCDTFKVDNASGIAGPPNCSLAGTSLPDCALAQAWNDRFRKEGKPEAKRELYKAAVAYLQAIAAQSIAIEQSFREIDVRHRETLLARRSAIEGWNNIVSVPIDQLNAYYSGGVKPAELADLIIKALGLTAIAVGVNK